MKRVNALFVAVLLIFAVGTGFAWPWSSKDKTVDNTQIQDSLQREKLNELRREVDALIRIRLQKADSLEKLEAEHWRKRYAEAQMTEEHQVTSRELDGRYSKLSTDLGRVNEEVLASKDVTVEAEDKAKGDEIAFDALHTQIRLSIEKSLADIPGDYPVGMANRLVQLQGAIAESEKKNASTLTILKTYVDDLLLRHGLTITQSYTMAVSQVGKRPDVKTYRLRLGTIFLGERASDSGEIQALLRTGTLQGKKYEWNTSLPEGMVSSINMALVGAGEYRSQIEIPLDVLQNKAMKNSISDSKDATLQEAIVAWFKKGGLVMYPLMLAAIFALILCLERFLVLMYRGHLSKRFMKKLNALLKECRYEDAASLCLKKETSLSMVLFAVLNKASENRDAAEKSLQEALLREQPKLERRMGLLAAIGSIAPLLGLLGTVTGIITLFTVITEVGTNDARVLAGGISEALVTTEAGLIIAIPVMILHGLLSEKIEKVISELYVQSTSLLNRIFHE